MGPRKRSEAGVPISAEMVGRVSVEVTRADLQEAVVAPVIRGMVIARGCCTEFDVTSLVKSSGILRLAPLLGPLYG